MIPRDLTKKPSASSLIAGDENSPACNSQTIHSIRSKRNLDTPMIIYAKIVKDENSCRTS